MRREGSFSGDGGRAASTSRTTPHSALSPGRIGPNTADSALREKRPPSPRPATRGRPPPTSHIHMSWSLSRERAFFSHSRR
eukprot:scaffold260696_cov30-Tisochrysis_lutea.AAC.1